MPRLPAIKPPLSGTSVEVINAIRNEASADYKSFVPFVQDNTESIREIGAIIMQYPTLQNEFLHSLVNRIGRVILTSKLYTNPWADFKKGLLEYGETVEEIFIELAKPYQYDATEPVDEWYKDEEPDVRTTFHVRNYRVVYPVTVTNDELRAAFLSAQGVTDLIAKIIDSLFTAMNYDEFLVMKYLLARHLINGRLKTVQIPTPAPDTMTQVAGVFRGVSNLFTFMSPDFTIAGVHSHSAKEDQFLILPALFSGQLDTEQLAAAFNLSYAEFMGHRKLVDSFAKLDNARLAVLFKGVPEYEPITEEQLATLSNIPAVLIDRQFFQIFDNYENMTEQYFGNKLRWKYWLHTWKTFSVSPYANAVVFVSSPGTVDGITVTPNSAVANVGQRIVMLADVATTGIIDKTVTWSIDSAFSSITQGGVLHVSEDETASTIIVTVTSVANPSVTATATITVVNP